MKWESKWKRTKCLDSMFLGVLLFSSSETIRQNRTTWCLKTPECSAAYTLGTNDKKGPLNLKGFKCFLCSHTTIFFSLSEKKRPKQVCSFHNSWQVAGSHSLWNLLNCIIDLSHETHSLFWSPTRLWADWRSRLKCVNSCQCFPHIVDL